MILKDKFIQKSRKDHICSDCGRRILKGQGYRYMYGAPEMYDKPYALKLCFKCDEDREHDYDE